MGKVAGSYPENEQILGYLLEETGQRQDTPTDADIIIGFLKLKLVTFNFSYLGAEEFEQGRAILSYNQRTIAINSEIHPKQVSFSKFHEIAHYVLPQHVKTFYLCKASDMSLLQTAPLEVEANEFAADLIFKGDIFTIESNSVEISFNSIIPLADKYGSSIESTARRFVKYNFRPCIFVSYEKKNNVWTVRYSIFSKAFSEKYFQNSKKGTLTDDNNPDVIQAELQPKEIIEKGCKMSIKDEAEKEFICEYFNNTHNIFALIKEK